MPIFLYALLLWSCTSTCFAASLHWVDREGFHAVERLDKVPLEHRHRLPMVRHGISLPFTREEDRDGALYVWFMLGRAGVDYPFARARDLPASRFFLQVPEPRSGDVAWWKGYVGLYQGKEGSISVASGEVALKTLEKKRGKVTWYRYAARPEAKGAVKGGASPAALKAADASLLRLDAAATFPPRVKDDAERAHIVKEWEKTAQGLERLRRKFPDDPQVLRRLGVCHRMGYNLGIPGSWERAEAYLLRTQELLPQTAEAFISLGILYADSGVEQAELAEKEFRTALIHARQEQLPQIWWGLGLALHYRGKTKEALEMVDLLIARHPEDGAARKLRERIVQEGEGS